MNPLHNDPVFNRDYPKFVFQYPDVRVVNNDLPPPKPFSLKPPEKAGKPSKDLKKQDQSKREDKKSR